MLGVASILYVLASLLLVGCDPIWIDVSLQFVGCLTLCGTLQVLSSVLCVW